MLWLAFGPVPMAGIAGLGVAFGRPPSPSELAFDLCLASVAIGAGVLFIVAFRGWLARWRSRGTPSGVQLPR